MALWGELSFVGYATCFDPETEGARHSYGILCCGDSRIDKYGISTHLHTFGGVARAAYARIDDDGDGTLGDDDT